jgi:hypothetical protein
MNKMDALFQQVAYAFREVPYPGDQNIVCHDCDECFTILQHFRGLSPQEATPEIIAEHFDSLPLLTAEAKQYLLPAYLRESIRDPHSLVCQFTLYTLEDVHRMAPHGGYTVSQRSAINAFIDYIASQAGEEYVNELARAKTQWKQ